MGTTYKQLYNKLMQSCNVVPVTVAKECINEALRDIYDANDWGFLVKNSYIRTPAIIQGTANVSQFGTSVQVDSAVAILIAAISVDQVPILERQLRIKSPTQTDPGFFYSITDYTSVAGAKADGSIQISSPNDGDFFTLNGVVFTFRDAPVFPTDVLIDATFNNGITALSLLATIASYADPDVDLASYVNAGGGLVNIEYNSNGVVGNIYTLATSNVGTLIISGATLTGGIDDDFGTLTIDPPYQDITTNGIQIEIVKFLYTAPTIDIGTPTSPNPVIDFRRWEYILSPQDRRRILIESDSYSKNYWFGRFRDYIGDPRVFIPYEADSEGNQRWELYPAPRNEKVFRVIYWRNGIALDRDSDQLPTNVLSVELILSRAKQKAYEWVIANQQELGLRSVTGYFNLIALLNNRNSVSSYDRLLEKAISRDEELYPKAFAGDFADWNYFDDLLYDGYDATLPHDRFGETVVIDASI